MAGQLLDTEPTGMQTCITVNLLCCRPPGLLPSRPAVLRHSGLLSGRPSIVPASWFVVLLLGRSAVLQDCRSAGMRACRNFRIPACWN
jgi:hypothetical protein